MPKLYCYEDGDRPTNPHAIVVDVTPADNARYIDGQNAWLNERKRGQYEAGPWVRVTDQASGSDFEVRSVACGLRCRCGAQARPVAA